MATAGTVNVKFTAQTAAFEAGMKKVDGLLGGLGGSLKLIAGLATGFLAWKGTAFVKQTMQAIDVTAKMADRLGLTTEAMVGLQHAGDLAGVSAESMAKSIEKMGANLADVGKPSVEIVDAIEKMGMSFADLRGYAPEEQLAKIADGLQTLNSSGERAAVSMAIFGKGGLELQQVLSGGSAALAEAREEADALGITFNRLDAFKVEQANDALTRVSATFKGGFTAAAIELSPLIEAIATQFVESAKAAGGFGKITLSVLDQVQKGVGFLGDAWNVLATAWHAGATVAFTVASAWIKAVQTVSAFMSNASEAVSASWAVMGSAVSEVWAAIGLLVDKSISGMVSGISKLLHKTADAATALGADLSGVRETAYDMGLSVGDFTVHAERKLQRLSKESEAAGERAKKAWAGLFDISATMEADPLSGWYDMAAARMQTAGQESAFAFTESFTAVLNQDASVGIADWFAQIEALSTASAEASAARVAARLEQDRVAGEEQVAMAEARESYLSEMFGNQAEKRLAWDKHTLDQRLSYTSNILGNLATLQNTSSRKMFEVGKIAAYANAVVSTAAGIARQFADLPIYAAIPAAIAVAAAGAVQIASIASTSFGGGGSVSSAGGSIPLVNGEPAGVQASAQGAVQPTTNMLQVSISGLDDDAIVSGRAIRNIIEGINEAQRDGSPIDRVDVRAA